MTAQDVFGAALLDYFEGNVAQSLILATDDGRKTPAMPPEWYFLTEDSWFDWERDALAEAEGPVLDLGAGAGRAALFLQGRGVEVTAVDNSPGAVEVCHRRGIGDVRLLDFVGHLPDDRKWRTVLLLCGNLGLAGSWQTTRRLLVRLSEICANNAVIIADTVDPTVSADAQDRLYQRKMGARGEYIGRVTLQLHYGALLSPWWSQINIRVRDVSALVKDTGWHVEDHCVAGMDHYVKMRRD